MDWPTTTRMVLRPDGGELVRAYQAHRQPRWCRVMRALAVQDTRPLACILITCASAKPSASQRG